MSQNKNIFISIFLVALAGGIYLLSTKDAGSDAVGESAWLSGIFGSQKTASSTAGSLVADLPREAEVTLAGKTIHPALSDTPEEQEVGLTSVSTLSDEQGMLYLFDNKEPVSFWNKDMKMSYDLVWVLDGIVVGIDSNIPLYGGGEDYLVLDSPGDVNGALELSAGWTGRYGLKPGDTVTATKL